MRINEQGESRLVAVMDRVIGEALVAATVILGLLLCVGAARADEPVRKEMTGASAAAIVQSAPSPAEGRP